MQTRPTSEPDRSRVRSPRNPASRVLARLMSSLRGDKYMIGAYPPVGRGDAPDPDPSPTPAMAGTKER